MATTVKRAHNALPISATWKPDKTMSALRSLVRACRATPTQSVPRDSVAIGARLTIAAVPLPLIHFPRTTPSNACISPLAQEATSVGAQNIGSVSARLAEAEGAGRPSLWANRVAIGTTALRIFVESGVQTLYFAVQVVAH